MWIAAVLLLTASGDGCKSENPVFAHGPDAGGTDTTHEVSAGTPDGADDRPALGVDAGLDAGADDAGCGPATTLVGYWKLDETSGILAADSSCGHNDGMLIGFDTPAWQPGMVGGALSFNGLNQFVRVPDRSDHLDAIVASNALTVAFWVYRQAKSNFLYATAIEREYRNTNSELFNISFDDSNAGAVSLWINPYQSANTHCTAQKVPPLGRWVHLAATYDGKIGRLYVDGIEDCSFSAASTFEAETNPLTLGASFNAGSVDPQEPLSGMLDDVALYSRILSATEIADIAFGGPPPLQ